MNAYFCHQTGVRIAPPKPGEDAHQPRVCKAVDPEHGADEFSEQPVPTASAKPSGKAVVSDKPSTEKKAE